MPRSKHRRSSELAFLLVAALALLISAAVGARADDDDDVAAYKQAVSNGTALFAQADYAGARAAFEKAFDIHADPVLVFNIASTYRREGDLEQAVTAYKRYLSLATDGDKARKQLARETIDSLQDTIDRRAADERAERERQERRAAQERAERERKIRAARAAAAERAAREQADEAPTDAPPSLHVDRDPRSPWGPRLRLTGKIVGAAGGLALALAGYDAARARDAQIRLTGVTSWNDREAKLYRDGTDARHRAIVAGAIGLGLVGVGTTLYLVGRDSPREHRVTVTPTVSDDGAGAQVSGSF